MRSLKHTLAAGGIAALLAMAFASSALASSHHPTGDYANFGECPLSNAEVIECIYSLSTGGSVTIGKKTVPVENPVTFQGGLKESHEFVGAENGVTLSKTPQPVPGGLVGITAPAWWPKLVRDWFNKLISEGFTGVNAIVELAAPANKVVVGTENLINSEGTALGLPVKIKLENLILGNNCYIGSNEKPVQIDFTTGTSGSLEGYFGEITFNESFTVVTIEGARLVNGTFSAPATTGCGGLFSIFVNPLVNEILGTPSGSGKNSAILEANLQDANASFVKASE